ncbi:hypothetical protein MPTK1_5g22440 [Marchantia polymorpha subsp. ruderalis]|uniref:Uncharacterized protein n=2 Tax=Marchantia polymorpha TaxID=3197 RepID=A0AAF6BL44_MARPO|nr:hypothetical protein MARPO_0010s0213 [Marchantia polymorpha]BBN12728.1 hypothetical protein Mp_5g22440 [Marchantia polymorpha subsp. ruderalis]|eukprot:PTQ46854.1 hypothetical protein MARPO_0010s0213 [Marchantia polymorpha]
MDDNNLVYPEQRVRDGSKLQGAAVTEAPEEGKKQRRKIHRNTIRWYTNVFELENGRGHRDRACQLDEMLNYRDYKRHKTDGSMYGKAYRTAQHEFKPGKIGRLPLSDPETPSPSPLSLPFPFPFGSPLAGDCATGARCFPFPSPKPRELHRRHQLALVDLPESVVLSRRGVERAIESRRSSNASQTDHNRELRSTHELKS